MTKLKSIEYKGYNIDIFGEYWNKKVTIYLTVDYGNYVPIPAIFKDKVTITEIKERKFLFWTLQKSISLKKQVQYWIDTYEEIAKKLIDERVYNKEITDGMLDSLDRV